jgi:hypothetical protein
MAVGLQVLAPTLSLNLNFQLVLLSIAYVPFLTGHDLQKVLLGPVHCGVLKAFVPTTSKNRIARSDTSAHFCSYVSIMKMGFSKADRERKTFERSQKQRVEYNRRVARLRKSEYPMLQSVSLFINSVINATDI